MATPRICFIGLGEAATAMISGWGESRAAMIRSWDIKSSVPATSDEITARASALGVIANGSAQEALADADLVFCTVTADQAVAAAQSYAGFWRRARCGAI